MVRQGINPPTISALNYLPSFLWIFYSVTSVAQSCLTLCEPHGLQHTRFSCPSPKFLDLVQTHVCWVGDAIQISYPLSSSSPPAFNLSQHKGLFQWVSALHQVAKVLELQLQHQPFQWIFRTDLIWCWLFDLPAVQRTLKNLLQHHCRKASILGRSAFLMVQFSHVYITTGKTTVLLDGPLSAKWCLCFLYAV